MPDGSRLGQKLAAEALGTFVLVLFGVGAALMSRGDYVTTGLGFGLAVLVMVYAVGRVSGGHFNPAVSLGAALAGRISWRDAALYALVQVVGGCSGGVTLWVLMRGFGGFDSERAFGQNFFGDASPEGYAWWAAFGLELLMTAIFVGVILAVTDARQPHAAMAPLAIGLTLAVIHFASMRATGTSVNPARSIGAGLFAGMEAIRQLWLFITAPLLGGVLAGAAYPLVFGRDADPVPGSGVRLRSTTPVGMPVYDAPDAFERQWNPTGYPQQWPGGAPWEPPPGVSPADLPPPEAAPWDVHLPGPTEPYWSQQLPREWGNLDDDEDGHTQIRPTDG